MVPPFLAYYGVLTGNDTLVQESYNQASSRSSVLATLIRPYVKAITIIVERCCLLSLPFFLLADTTLRLNTTANIYSTIHCPCGATFCSVITASRTLTSGQLVSCLEVDAPFRQFFCQAD